MFIHLVHRNWLHASIHNFLETSAAYMCCCPSCWCVSVWYVFCYGLASRVQVNTQCAVQKLTSILPSNMLIVRNFKLVGFVSSILKQYCMGHVGQKNLNSYSIILYRLPLVIKYILRSWTLLLVHGEWCLLISTAGVTMACKIVVSFIGFQILSEGTKYCISFSLILSVLS